jgi:hypothetical protein
MIVCNHCGAKLSLGTMFCAACGQRVTVDFSMVQQSVNQQQNKQLSDNIWQTGRNALAFAVFLISAAMILRYLMVPQPPVAEMPLQSAQSASAIFHPTMPAWIRRDGPAKSSAAPAANLSALADRDPSLLAWRKRQGDFVLGSTGVDLTQIGNWQIAILNKQRPDGSWAGGDPLAATGLACLALQAYPGLPEIEPALHKAWPWLLSRVTRPLANRDPLAFHLAAWALIDAGRLEPAQIATLRPSMTDGSLAKWQALALMSLPPKDRPERISALRISLRDPLWQHTIQPFANEPAGKPNLDLFGPDTLGSIQEIDRIAWMCGLWRLGHDPKLMREVLRDWTKDTTAPTAPASLRTLAGEIPADHGMAILATTAPLRCPMTWVAGSQ